MFINMPFTTLLPQGQQINGPTMGMLETRPDGTQQLLLGPQMHSPAPFLSLPFIPTQVVPMQPVAPQLPAAVDPMAMNQLPAHQQTRLFHGLGIKPDSINWPLSPELQTLAQNFNHFNADPMVRQMLDLQPQSSIEHQARQLTDTLTRKLITDAQMKAEELYLQLIKNPLLGPNSALVAGSFRPDGTMVRPRLSQANPTVIQNLGNPFIKDLPTNAQPVRGRGRMSLNEIRQNAVAAVNDAVQKYPNLRNVPKQDLVAAVIGMTLTESSGNSNAVGGAGELGPMQVKPSTAKGVKGFNNLNPQQLHDKFTGMLVGTHYLASILSDQLAKNGGRYNQDLLKLSISKYNTGPAASRVNNHYVSKVVKNATQNA
jgi:hypothetical protein